MPDTPEILAAERNTEMVDFAPKSDADEVYAGNDAAADAARRCVDQLRRIAKVQVPVDYGYLLAKNFRDFVIAENARSANIGKGLGGEGDALAKASDLRMDDWIRSGKEMTRLALENRKLLDFKTYVHQRLDEAGIPTHPNGKHSKEGCRVGDRLDILIERTWPTQAERAAQLAKEARYETRLADSAKLVSLIDAIGLQPPDGGWADGELESVLETRRMANEATTATLAEARKKSNKLYQLITQTMSDNWNGGDRPQSPPAWFLRIVVEAARLSNIFAPPPTNKAEGT